VKTLNVEELSEAQRKHFEDVKARWWKKAAGLRTTLIGRYIEDRNGSLFAVAEDSSKSLFSADRCWVEPLLF
jgi:hypothetical protein